MSAQSRAVLSIAVVFLTGLVAGALLMNVMEHFWMHPAEARFVPAARSTSPAWAANREHYIEEFKKELNLTDAQSKQLQAILDETMKQYIDLHSFSHHIRDDGIARIRAMLDDNQRKKFDDITRKLNADEQKARRKQAPPKQ